MAVTEESRQITPEEVWGSLAPADANRVREVLIQIAEELIIHSSSNNLYAPSSTEGEPLEQLMP